MQFAVRQAIGQIRNDLFEDGNVHVFTLGTDTLELAEIAQRAGAGKLVLTHLIPGPPNRIARRLFTLGMEERFSGPVVVAEDGMEFVLRP